MALLDRDGRGADEVPPNGRTSPVPSGRLPCAVSGAEMYAHFINNAVEGILDWSDLRSILSHGISLPRPVEIHLMRHGETVTNAHGLVTGSLDVSLTAAGAEQAKQIGFKLDPHYDLALHSTLLRSIKTLSFALDSGHVKVDAIQPDFRLNERSLGALELRRSMPVDQYALGDLNYAPVGGESYAEVARRCLSLLLDLLELVWEKNIAKILVSGHMGPMRILIGILEEQSDPIRVLARSFENTEVIRVSWNRLVMPGFLRDL